MKLIVGLGNPGSKYAGTRHNVGFEVVDLLARRWGILLGREQFHGWFGVGAAGQTKVALLKPTTYMNRSGQAVLAAGRFYQLEAADLLVVADDLALEAGVIRIRGSGSAGGHNGLRDIIERLGTEAFARMRLGIGGAGGDAVGYVLSRFAPEEAPMMARTIERAADAAATWVMEGLDSAMNRYNGRTVLD